MKSIGLPYKLEPMKVQKKMDYDKTDKYCVTKDNVVIHDVANLNQLYL